MDFQQNVISSASQPGERAETKTAQQIPSVLPLNYSVTPQAISTMQPVAPSGIEGEPTNTVSSDTVDRSSHEADNPAAALRNLPPQTSHLVGAATVAVGHTYDAGQGFYVEPTLTTVKAEVKQSVDDSSISCPPRQKRRRTAGSSSSTAASDASTSSSAAATAAATVTVEGADPVGDCGNAVGVFSGGSAAVYPRKGRAGLRKSTDTRKNNNRVALRDFTCGRRCVTDVKQIESPMVLRLKVVNGISTERVLRKNKKSILLDVGQRFGVLQLFVEGHPKPDEKVWVTTEKGAAPVPSVAVEHTMGQLTIDVREFPIIARGKVRRDPQKQGTRPKAGEPIIDCYAIFVDDERRPLWVDSSLITPDQIRVLSPQPMQQIPSAQSVPVIDQSQMPVPQMPQTQPTQQMASSDPSMPISVQQEDQSQVQQLNR